MRFKSKKIVALGTIFLFLSSNLSFAANVGAPLAGARRDRAGTSPTPTLEVAKIQVPPELGKIQEFYDSNPQKLVVTRSRSPIPDSYPPVILIQDAHAIPDAQRNIQKLITYFQKQYGIRLVGLEGAASKADPQIFQSFPDKALLKKTFEEYMARGELAGANAAAIFSPSVGAPLAGAREAQAEEKGTGSGFLPVPFSAAPTMFHGVENWKVYEEGLALYLVALQQEPEVLKIVKREELRVKREKEKTYSKQLLEIDQALEDFHAGQGDLAVVLKKMSMVGAPLAGAQRHRAGTSPAPTLEEKGTGSGFLPVPFSIKTLLEEINSDKGYWGKDELKREQKYSQLSSRFQSEFESYTRAVKENLFRNDAERTLDRESHQVDLLSKLAKLELSRGEWSEVKTGVGAPLAGARSPGRGQAPPLQSFSNHLAFYENAEKRDGAFLENLMKLMRLSSPKMDSRFRGNDRTGAILVAGGFHSQGLAERLRAKGISYVLVTPEIKSIPEQTHYRDQMRGDVSWKNYFEVENGRINLYKAFVRATRDRLVYKPQTIDHSPESIEKFKTQISDKSRGYGLWTIDYGLVKRWRDQIIRDLSEKDQIEKAGNYTVFLDETVKKESNNKIQQGLARAEAFLSGLRILESSHQLTEQNILKLLNPSTAQSQIGPILTGDLLLASLAQGISKSEARAAAPEIQNQAIELEIQEAFRNARDLSARSSELGRVIQLSTTEGHGLWKSLSEMAKTRLIEKIVAIQKMTPFVQYTRVEHLPGEVLGAFSGGYDVFGLVGEKGEISGVIYSQPEKNSIIYMKQLMTFPQKEGRGRFLMESYLQQMKLQGTKEVILGAIFLSDLFYHSLLSELEISYKFDESQSIFYLNLEKSLIENGRLIRDKNQVSDQEAEAQIIFAQKLNERYAEVTEKLKNLKTGIYIYEPPQRVRRIYFSVGNASLPLQKILAEQAIAGEKLLIEKDMIRALVLNPDKEEGPIAARLLKLEGGEAAEEIVIDRSGIPSLSDFKTSMVRSEVRSVQKDDEAERREIAVMSVEGHSLLDRLMGSYLFVLKVNVEMIIDDLANGNEIKEQLLQYDGKINRFQDQFKNAEGNLKKGEDPSGLIPEIFKNFLIETQDFEKYLEEIRADLLEIFKADGVWADILQHISDVLPEVIDVLEAQIEFTKGDYHFTPVFLNDWIGDTNRLIGSKASIEGQLDLRKGKAGSFLPPLPVQSRLLRRLVGELAKNSKKAAGDRKIENPYFEISAELDAENQEMVLTFKDNAGGIPEDLLKDRTVAGKIVSGRPAIFYRDVSTKGGGLGLAEAWHIVKGHGGRIKAEVWNDEKDKPAGTFFRIYLPLYQPDTLDNTLDRLAAELKAEEGQPNPVLFISGFQGSGKSRLAKDLEKTIEDKGNDAVVIETDWFLKYTAKDMPKILGLRVLVINFITQLSFLPRWAYNFLIKMLVRLLFDSVKVDDLKKQLNVLEKTLQDKGAVTLEVLLPGKKTWDKFPVKKGTVIIFEGILGRTVFGASLPQAKTLLLHLPAEKAREAYIRREESSGLDPRRAKFISRFVIREITKAEKETFNFVLDASRRAEDKFTLKKKLKVPVNPPRSEARAASKERTLKKMRGILHKMAGIVKKGNLTDADLLTYRGQVEGLLSERAFEIVEGRTENTGPAEVPENENDVLRTILQAFAAHFLDNPFPIQRDEYQDFNILVRHYNEKIKSSPEAYSHFPVSAPFLAVQSVSGLMDIKDYIDLSEKLSIFPGIDGMRTIATDLLFSAIHIESQMDALDLVAPGPSLEAAFKILQKERRNRESPEMQEALEELRFSVARFLVAIREILPPGSFARFFRKTKIDDLDLEDMASRKIKTWKKKAEKTIAVILTNVDLAIEILEEIEARESGHLDISAFRLKWAYLDEFLDQNGMLLSDSLEKVLVWPIRYPRDVDRIYKGLDQTIFAEPLHPASVRLNIKKTLGTLRTLSRIKKTKNRAEVRSAGGERRDVKIGDRRNRLRIERKGIIQTFFSSLWQSLWYVIRLFLSVVLAIDPQRRAIFHNLRQARAEILRANDQLGKRFTAELFYLSFPLINGLNFQEDSFKSLLERLWRFHPDYSQMRVSLKKQMLEIKNLIHTLQNNPFGPEGEKYFQNYEGELNKVVRRLESALFYSKQAEKGIKARLTPRRVLLRGRKDHGTEVVHFIKSFEDLSQQGAELDAAGTGQETFDLRTEHDRLAYFTPPGKEEALIAYYGLDLGHDPDFPDDEHPVILEREAPGKKITALYISTGKDKKEFLQLEILEDKAKGKTQPLLKASLVHFLERRPGILDLTKVIENPLRSEARAAGERPATVPGTHPQVRAEARASFEDSLKMAGEQLRKLMGANFKLEVSGKIPGEKLSPKIFKGWYEFLQFSGLKGEFLKKIILTVPEPGGTGNESRYSENDQNILLNVSSSLFSRGNFDGYREFAGILLKQYGQEDPSLETREKEYLKNYLAWKVLQEVNPPEAEKYYKSRVAPYATPGDSEIEKEIRKNVKSLGDRALTAIHQGSPVFAEVSAFEREIAKSFAENGGKTALPLTYRQFLNSLDQNQRQFLHELQAEALGGAWFLRGRKDHDDEDVYEGITRSVSMFGAGKEDSIKEIKENITRAYAAFHDTMRSRLGSPERLLGPTVSLTSYSTFTALMALQTRKLPSFGGVTDSLRLQDETNAIIFHFLGLPTEGYYSEKPLEMTRYSGLPAVKVSRSQKSGTVTMEIWIGKNPYEVTSQAALLERLRKGYKIKLIELAEGNIRFTNPIYDRDYTDVQWDDAEALESAIRTALAGNFLADATKKGNQITKFYADLRGGQLTEEGKKKPSKRTEEEKTRLEERKKELGKLMAKSDEIIDIAELLTQAGMPNANIADLKSRDGRVLVTAGALGAKKGTGFEPDNVLVELSQQSLREKRITDELIRNPNIEFRNEDFFLKKNEMDLSAYDVVFFDEAGTDTKRGPEQNGAADLVPLFQTMKPGARLIVYNARALVPEALNFMDASLPIHTGKLVSNFSYIYTRRSEARHKPADFAVRNHWDSARSEARMEKGSEIAKVLTDLRSILDKIKRPPAKDLPGYFWTELLEEQTLIDLFKRKSSKADDIKNFLTTRKWKNFDWKKSRYDKPVTPVAAAIFTAILTLENNFPEEIRKILGEKKPETQPETSSETLSPGLNRESLSGERPAEITFDEQLWAMLPEEVKDKIRRVIANYKTSWLDGDIEGEVGFSKDKRAVKIAWKGMVNGEEIDGIEVSGVLFTRENLGKDFKGLSAGATGYSIEDLPEDMIKTDGINIAVSPDGRPNLTPAEYAQVGGHGYKTAKKKFENARIALPTRGLRGPIAVGYAKYDGLSKNNEPLGVFISASRKGGERFNAIWHREREAFEKKIQTELDRVNKKVMESGQMEEHLKRLSQTGFGLRVEIPPQDVARKIGGYEFLDRIAERYGQLLRSVIDKGLYPHTPHFANFQADLEGKMEPVWYDLGGWHRREELTPQQAFGYAYMTLTFAFTVIKRDLVNHYEDLFEAKLIDPYKAFIRGFFYDQLQNPLLNYSDFKIDPQGRNTLEYVAYDEKYLRNPLSLPPLYERPDAPFVPILREIMKEKMGLTQEENLRKVRFEGKEKNARSIDMVFDKEFLRIIQEYDSRESDNVMERLERIVSQYPAAWKQGDYDKQIGGAKQKRTVSIRFKKPVQFRDEVLEAIEITGVLFTEANLGKPFLGMVMVGTDKTSEELPGGEKIGKTGFSMRRDGRPVWKDEAYAQLGGHGGQSAKRKFFRARTLLPSLQLRGPLAIAYGTYHIDQKSGKKIQKDGNSLGVFISGVRKGSPARYGDLLKEKIQTLWTLIQSQQSQTPVEGQVIQANFPPESFGEFAAMYQKYGRELRSLIDKELYPHQPHWGNMSVDLKANQPTTWHDLGGWTLGKDPELAESDQLNAAQKFGYTYFVLYMALVAINGHLHGFLQRGLYDHGGVDPYTEFLKGFFHDQLKNPLLKRESLGFDNQEYKALDNVLSDFRYAILPSSVPPLHERLDAPLVPLLRQMLGFDKISVSTTSAIPKPVAQAVLPTSWEFSADTIIAELEKRNVEKIEVQGHSGDYSLEKFKADILPKLVLLIERAKYKFEVSVGEDRIARIRMRSEARSTADLASFWKSGDLVRAYSVEDIREIQGLQVSEKVPSLGSSHPFSIYRGKWASKDAEEDLIWEYQLKHEVHIFRKMQKHSAALLEKEGKIPPGGGIYTPRYFFPGIWNPDTSGLIFHKWEGETLAQKYVRLHPLSFFTGPFEFQKLALEMTRALGYLHAMGIVHRDIKPDNFAMLKDGKIILIDLESAVDLEEKDAGNDIERLIPGTVEYMPPEALEGAVSPENDVFSLGLSLAEIWSHQSTSALTVQIRKRQATDVRPRLAKILEDNPLREIIEKALHPDPKQRYANAVEMAHAIEEKMNNNQRVRRDFVPREFWHALKINDLSAIGDPEKPGEMLVWKRDGSLSPEDIESRLETFKMEGLEIVGREEKAVRFRDRNGLLFPGPFYHGSILDSRFLGLQRELAKDRPVVVFDLDGTLAWVRHNEKGQIVYDEEGIPILDFRNDVYLDEILKALAKRDVRPVVWTAANHNYTEVFQKAWEKQFPDYPWRLILTRENLKPLDWKSDAWQAKDPLYLYGDDKGQYFKSPQDLELPIQEALRPYSPEIASLGGDLERTARFFSRHIIYAKPAALLGPNVVILDDHVMRGDGLEEFWNIETQASESPFGPLQAIAVSKFTGKETVSEEEREKNTQEWINKIFKKLALTGQHLEDLSAEVISAVEKYFEARDLQPLVHQGFQAGLEKVGHLITDTLKDVYPEEPNVHPTERELLQTGVLELFDNAKQHGGESEPLLLGRTIKAGERQAIELIVADRGPGIKSEQIPGIREAAKFRVSRTGRKDRGAGLFAARQVVMLGEGGILDVASGKERVIFDDLEGDGRDAPVQISRGTLVRMIRFLPVAKTQPNARAEVRMSEAEMSVAIDGIRQNVEKKVFLGQDRTRLDEILTESEQRKDLGLLEKILWMRFEYYEQWAHDSKIEHERLNRYLKAQPAILALAGMFPRDQKIRYELALNYFHLGRKKDRKPLDESEELLLSLLNQENLEPGIARGAAITLAYLRQKQADWSFLDFKKDSSAAKEDLRAILSLTDRAAQIFWAVLSEFLRSREEKDFQIPRALDGLSNSENLRQKIYLSLADLETSEPPRQSRRLLQALETAARSLKNVSEAMSRRSQNPDSPLAHSRIFYGKILDRLAGQARKSNGTLADLGPVGAMAQKGTVFYNEKDLTKLGATLKRIERGLENNGTQDPRTAQIKEWIRKIREDIALVANLKIQIREQALRLLDNHAFLSPDEFREKLKNSINAARYFDEIYAGFSLSLEGLFVLREALDISNKSKLEGNIPPEKLGEIAEIVTMQLQEINLDTVAWDSKKVEEQFKNPFFAFLGLRIGHPVLASKAQSQSSVEEEGKPADRETYSDAEIKNYKKKDSDRFKSLQARASRTNDWMKESRRVRNQQLLDQIQKNLDEFLVLWETWNTNKNNKDKTAKLDPYRSKLLAQEMVNSRMKKAGEGGYPALMGELERRLDNDEEFVLGYIRTGNAQGREDGDALRKAESEVVQSAAESMDILPVSSEKWGLSGIESWIAQLKEWQKLFGFGWLKDKVLALEEIKNQMEELLQAKSEVYLSREQYFRLITDGAAIYLPVQEYFSQAEITLKPFREYLNKLHAGMKSLEKAQPRLKGDEEKRKHLNELLKEYGRISGEFRRTLFDPNYWKDEARSSKLLKEMADLVQAIDEMVKLDEKWVADQRAAFEKEFVGLLKEKEEDLLVQLVYRERNSFRNAPQVQRDSFRENIKASMDLEAWVRRFSTQIDNGAPEALKAAGQGLESMVKTLQEQMEKLLELPAGSETGVTFPPEEPGPRYEEFRETLEKGIDGKRYAQSNEKELFLGWAKLLNLSVEFYDRPVNGTPYKIGLEGKVLGHLWIATDITNAERLKLATELGKQLNLPPSPLRGEDENRPEAKEWKERFLKSLSRLEPFYEPSDAAFIWADTSLSATLMEAAIARMESLMELDSKGGENVRRVLKDLDEDIPNKISFSELLGRLLRKLDFSDSRNFELLPAILIKDYHFPKKALSDSTFKEYAWIQIIRAKAQLQAGYTVFDFDFFNSNSKSIETGNWQFGEAVLGKRIYKINDGRQDKNKAELKFVSPHLGSLLAKQLVWGSSAQIAITTSVATVPSRTLYALPMLEYLYSQFWNYFSESKAEVLKKRMFLAADNPSFWSDLITEYDSAPAAFRTEKEAKLIDLIYENAGRAGEREPVVWFQSAKHQLWDALAKGDVQLVEAVGQGNLISLLVDAEYYREALSLGLLTGAMAHNTDAIKFMFVALIGKNLANTQSWEMISNLFMEFQFPAAARWIKENLPGKTLSNDPVEISRITREILGRVDFNQASQFLKSWHKAEEWVALLLRQNPALESDLQLKPYENESRQKLTARWADLLGFSLEFQDFSSMGVPYEIDIDPATKNLRGLRIARDISLRDLIVVARALRESLGLPPSPFEDLAENPEALKRQLDRIAVLTNPQESFLRLGELIFRTTLLQVSLKGIESLRGPNPQSLVPAFQPIMPEHSLNPKQTEEFVARLFQSMTGTSISSRKPMGFLLDTWWKGTWRPSDETTRFNHLLALILSCLNDDEDSPYTDLRKLREKGDIGLGANRFAVLSHFFSKLEYSNYWASFSQYEPKSESNRPKTALVAKAGQKPLFFSLDDESPNDILEESDALALKTPVFGETIRVPSAGKAVEVNGGVGISSPLQGLSTTLWFDLADKIKSEPGSEALLEEIYAHALAGDSMNPQIWWRLGNLYFQVGEYENALKAYSQVTELNENLAEGWASRGMTAFVAGTDDREDADAIRRAEAAMERAAQLNPVNQSYLFQLVIIRLRLQEWERAADVIQQVLNRSNSPAEGWENWAKYFDARSSFENVAAHIRTEILAEKDKIPATKPEISQALQAIAPMLRSEARAVPPEDIYSTAETPKSQTSKEEWSQGKALLAGDPQTHAFRAQKIIETVRQYPDTTIELSNVKGGLLPMDSASHLLSSLVFGQTLTIRSQGPFKDEALAIIKGWLEIPDSSLRRSELRSLDFQELEKEFLKSRKAYTRERTLFDLLGLAESSDPATSLKAKELLVHAFYDPEMEIRKGVKEYIEGQDAQNEQGLSTDLLLKWLSQADEYLPPEFESKTGGERKRGDPRLPSGETYDPKTQIYNGKEALLFSLAAKAWRKYGIEPVKKELEPVKNQFDLFEHEKNPDPDIFLNSKSPLVAAMARVLWEHVRLGKKSLSWREETVVTLLTALYDRDKATDIVDKILEIYKRKKQETFPGIEAPGQKGWSFEEIKNAARLAPKSEVRAQKLAARLAPYVIFRVGDKNEKPEDWARELASDFELKVFGLDDFEGAFRSEVRQLLERADQEANAAAVPQKILSKAEAKAVVSKMLTKFSELMDEIKLEDGLAMGFLQTEKDASFMEAFQLVGDRIALPLLTKEGTKMLAHELKGKAPGNISSDGRFSARRLKGVSNREALPILESGDTKATTQIVAGSFRVKGIEPGSLDFNPHMRVVAYVARMLAGLYAAALLKKASLLKEQDVSIQGKLQELFAMSGYVRIVQGELHFEDTLLEQLTQTLLTASEVDTAA